MKSGFGTAQCDMALLILEWLFEFKPNFGFLKGANMVTTQESQA